MLRVLCRYGLGVLPLLLWAGSAGRMPAAESSRVSPEVRAVAEANNQFAFDLYHNLKAADPKELFFSPASLSTALAMTYAGARGQTEREMAQTLRFRSEPDRLHAAFNALLARLSDPEQEAYQLHIANRLWGQAGHDFRPEFLGLTRQQYGAELAAVDFARQTEASRQKINAWVEQQTADKIQDLIPPGAVDGQTRLVLTNAVYFKGRWAKPFEQDATRQAPFHLSAQQQIEVPMMHQTSECRYAEAGAVQILELPYAGDDLSMVILLPREVAGLAELEQDLSAARLQQWLSGMRQQEVQIYLPRFRLTAEFPLNRTLAELGMPSAFAAQRADFSGIDGTRDLYLSAVIHKAFVDVNEEGTEAAAATGIAIRVTSVQAEPPVFRADRPFVFLIRDKATGSILFLGRVKRP